MKKFSLELILILRFEHIRSSSFVRTILVFDELNILTARKRKRDGFFISHLGWDKSKGAIIYHKHKSNF